MTARRSITVGYVGDFVITSAVRHLRRHHPDADVRSRHLNWDNAYTALADRRVDALVARAPFPFPTDHLRVTVLYDEPRVLVVPASHRLAGKQSVTLDDFVDEPLVRYPGPATPGARSGASNRAPTAVQPQPGLLSSRWKTSSNT